MLSMYFLIYSQKITFKFWQVMNDTRNKYQLDKQERSEGEYLAYKRIWSLYA